jgi:hypothetical protein
MVLALNSAKAQARVSELLDNPPGPSLRSALAAFASEHKVPV